MMRHLRQIINTGRDEAKNITMQEGCLYMDDQAAVGIIGLWNINIDHVCIRARILYEY